MHTFARTSRTGTLFQSQSDAWPEPSVANAFAPDRQADNGIPASSAAVPEQACTPRRRVLNLAADEGIIAAFLTVAPV